MTVVSGMLNTDAMNFVECPKCCQPAGSVCRDNRTKRLPVQHPERIAAYLKQFPKRKKLYPKEK
jgi:hypothetical protein